MSDYATNRLRSINGRRHFNDTRTHKNDKHKHTQKHTPGRNPSMDLDYANRLITFFFFFEEVVGFLFLRSAARLVVVL